MPGVLAIQIKVEDAQSWPIDNNVITVIGQLKPHEIFCYQKVVRCPTQEDIKYRVDSIDRD